MAWYTVSMSERPSPSSNPVTESPAGADHVAETAQQLTKRFREDLTSLWRADQSPGALAQGIHVLFTKLRQEAIDLGDRVSRQEAERIIQSMASAVAELSTGFETEQKTAVREAFLREFDKDALRELIDQDSTFVFLYPEEARSRPSEDVRMCLRSAKAYLDSSEGKERERFFAKIGESLHGVDVRKRIALIVGALEQATDRYNGRGEDVDYQEKERAGLATREWLQLLQKDVITEPEWAGRLINSLPAQEFKLGLVEVVLDGLSQSPIAVRSFEELLKQPLAPDEVFLEAALPMLVDRDIEKFSDEVKIPIRYLYKHGLYAKTGALGMRFFQGVADFVDAGKVQAEALKEIQNQKNYSAVSLLDHGVFLKKEKSLIAPELLPALCRDEGVGDRIWDYLRLFRQPVSQSIIQALRSGVYPKDQEGVLRWYPESLDIKAVEELIELGHRSVLLREIGTLKREAIPVLLSRGMYSEQDAIDFVHGLKWVDQKKPIPVSNDQLRMIMQYPQAMKKVLDLFDHMIIDQKEFVAIATETPEGARLLVDRLSRIPPGSISIAAARKLYEADPFKILDRPYVCTKEAQNDLVQRALTIPGQADKVLETLGFYDGLSLEALAPLQERGLGDVQVIQNLGSFHSEERLSVIKRLWVKDSGMMGRLVGSLTRYHAHEILDASIFDRLEAANNLLAVQDPQIFVSTEQGRLGEYLLKNGHVKQLEALLPLFGDGVLPGSIVDAMVTSKNIKMALRYRSKFREDISAHSQEILAVFERLLLRLEQSPSRTVRRMQEQLLDDLLQAEDPLTAYDRIESIFLRNHIPLAGKVFLAFDTIYGDKQYRKAFSPTLKESSARQSKMLVYRDLINIHLDTGNPSMRSYLEGLREMMPTLERLQAGEVLEASEQQRAEEFFRKVAVLHSLSPLKRSQEEGGSIARLREVFVSWKRSFGVREGQSMNDRLAEVFLRPAGVSSIDEALARMDGSRRSADEKNRAFYQEYREGLAFQEGDLLKGVDPQYFVSYLQHGCVSKEFLGYAADQDSTPLDTDTDLINREATKKPFQEAYKQSLAHDYGDTTLLMRPTEDRFVRTNEGAAPSVHAQLHDPLHRYEVFGSRLINENHQGIRTGVPFTEVRAIIMKTSNRRSMLDIKMDLVANGYYVPITDVDGKMLFTPEEFDELRALYAGSEAAPQEAYQEDRSTVDARQAASLEDLQARIEEERGRIEATREAIERRVEEALRSVGIALRTSGELAIGAEIMNTGSTARRTSIPGEVVDFDLVIRLDESDLSRQEAIKDALTNALRGTHQDGATAQWRRTGVDIGGVPVDIDITLVSKPEVEGISSHAIAEQRLRGIERGDAESANWVRANIVYAKKVLKQAGVYKKLDGGLGGLGVENWILQHGGSFAKAREAFLSAAIRQDGVTRSFEECAERYAIPDPGVNLIEKQVPDDGTQREHFRHDNFLYFLNKQGKDGYVKMVQALQNME